jgi:predicted O-methyltransferase YrrM
MKKILSLLKRIWILNFFRRLYIASRYYNRKYLRIIRWGFRSREDTNFTYHLTEDNLSYLAHTVAVVTKLDYEQIMKYMEELQSDEELKDTVRTAMENSPEKRFADKEIRFGRRLGWYAFARAIKPRVIIETGVDKGLGSVVLCAALLRNKEDGSEGRYYGTDINPKAGYLLEGRYREVGEILYGDSIESLSNFDGKIDLFINDSDHSADYEYREYLTIKDHISDGTIILGDNSHCTRKLADFSREMNRDFLFFKETPRDHWYPGAGIGISFKGR